MLRAKTVEEIKGIIQGLHEFNPMMGHRGLRLAVTYPEIAKMQTKAVIRAAINVQKKDQVGVGKLMEMAIKLGKPVNPNLHVGICGEHGGDPSSVEFCHKIGLDYVSCSPFRVPIARLAAAQAAIANK